ncbi:hypothetical protein GCM10007096_21490 [Pullulanibacillus pueri]|uniref:Uncharacterized protein n=1 Tax=Pullulanibacillus pueri TaxID=1437324 RepID=A0A8J3ELT0_9BACL|nr:hypothetical protein GCM10007096_21490 [Pullulanibacillus pueri]
MCKKSPQGQKLQSVRVSKSKEIKEAKERDPECTPYMRIERLQLTQRSAAQRKPQAPNTVVKLVRRW